MMISGENNHHMHDGYGKGMALSSDVKDTDKDKDEDLSIPPIFSVRIFTCTSQYFSCNGDT